MGRRKSKEEKANKQKQKQTGKLRRKGKKKKRIIKAICKSREDARPIHIKKKRKTKGEDQCNAAKIESARGMRISGNSNSKTENKKRQLRREREIRERARYQTGDIPPAFQKEIATTISQSG